MTHRIKSLKCTVLISVIFSLLLVPPMIYAYEHVNCPCVGIYEGECPDYSCGPDATDHRDGECGLKAGKCYYRGYSVTWHCEWYYPHVWCDGGVQ